MLEEVKYDDLHVTTKTFVIYTNLIFDKPALFDMFECQPLQYPLPSRKTMKVREEETLCNGDVIYVEYREMSKGTRMSKKNPKKEPGKMRNCITVIVYIETAQTRKYYNIKLSKNGTIQITGCIDEAAPLKILEFVWEFLSAREQIVFADWSPSADLYAYIVCRMCNVKFQLDKKVNRREFNNTIKLRAKNPRFTSTFEPSVGYMGLNIKVRTREQTIEETEVTRARCVKGGSFITDTVPFGEYLDLVRTRASVAAKEKYTDSFLVFFSGRVIMSGRISLVNRRHSYAAFLDFVREYGRYFLVS